MSAPVPQEWTTLIGHLSAAQVAEPMMNDRALGRDARDEAIIAYMRSMDGIYVCLSRLRENGELGRITLLLAKRERG